MNMSLGRFRLVNLVFLLLFSTLIKSEPIEGYKVELQILDKITSKVKVLEIKINETINYKSLNIEIFTCYKTPPEEIPEDFVLLRIQDFMIPNKNKLIYQGWMISSSPATTPLEHPIYDLWLKNCKISNDF